MSITTATHIPDRVSVTAAFVETAFEVKAQRDELLAALRNLVGASEWHTDVRKGTPDLTGEKLGLAIERARAAIAKAEAAPSYESQQ